MKTCCKCEKELNESKFWKDKSTKSGLQSQCKDCRTSNSSKIKKQLKEEGKKICSICGKKLDKSQFYKSKNNVDDLECRCKNCMKEKTNNYRKNNQEKIKNYRENNKDKDKQYRQNNKEKLSKYYKEYAEENKDKLKEYNKNYRIEYEQINKEEIKIKKQKYYQEHREEKLEKNKVYKKNNKHVVNLYMRERRKKDVNFRLAHNLRNIFKKAIDKNWKSGHTIEILGCSIDEFKKYIESKFTESMSWENYGKGFDKWNIDHIVPISSFKHLDTLGEQQKCFHYSNLQPLWETDNLQKSNKLDWSKS